MARQKTHASGMHHSSITHCLYNLKQTSEFEETEEPGRYRCPSCTRAYGETILGSTSLGRHLRGPKHQAAEVPITGIELDLPAPPPPLPLTETLPLLNMDDFRQDAAVPADDPGPSHNPLDGFFFENDKVYDANDQEILFSAGQVQQTQGQKRLADQLEAVREGWGEFLGIGYPEDSGDVEGPDDSDTMADAVRSMQWLGKSFEVICFLLHLRVQRNQHES